MNLEVYCTNQTHEQKSRHTVIVEESETNYFKGYLRTNLGRRKKPFITTLEKKP